MDGNKPKQRIETPVDNQTSLNLKTEHDQAPQVIGKDELGEEFQLPDYRDKSIFTKKQTPKWKKRKLRKIAYKSKRFNRKHAK